jgi:hypothetical protein
VGRFHLGRGRSDDERDVPAGASDVRLGQALVGVRPVELAPLRRIPRAAAAGEDEVAAAALDDEVVGGDERGEVLVAADRLFAVAVVELRDDAEAGLLRRVELDADAENLLSS